MGKLFNNKFIFKNINFLFESKICLMKIKVGNFKEYELDYRLYYNF